MIFVKKIIFRLFGLPLVNYIKSYFKFEDP